MARNRYSLNIDHDGTTEGGSRPTALPQALAACRRACFAEHRAARLSSVSLPGPTEPPLVPWQDECRPAS